MGYRTTEIRPHFPTLQRAGRFARRNQQDCRAPGDGGHPRGWGCSMKTARRCGAHGRGGRLPSAPAPPSPRAPPTRRARRACRPPLTPFSRHRRRPSSCWPRARLRPASSSSTGWLAARRSCLPVGADIEQLAQRLGEETMQGASPFAQVTPSPYKISGRLAKGIRGHRGQDAQPPKCHRATP